MGRGASAQVGETDWCFEGARGGGASSEESLSVSDPFFFTTVAHTGRDILGPFDVATWDAMLAKLPGDVAFQNVVDVGCGKGELLVRTLERTGASGIGVEHNPAFVAACRACVSARLPAGRAVILEGDFDPALVPEHGFDLGICTGSLHVFGDWRAALAGMARLVARGGHAIFGPGYWQRMPDPAYLQAIGGSEDEQHTLTHTLAIAEDDGWQVLACRESTRADWDDYEGAYATNTRRWCDAHPDDPDAHTHRDRIDRWAAAYEKWGRDTMGYALVLMRRG